MSMDGTTIALIGGIFTGFFGLIKYIVSQQQKQNEALQKSNDTFMTYIKEKNGHNERIANEFSQRVAEGQTILRELTAEVKNLSPKRRR